MLFSLDSQADKIVHQSCLPLWLKFVGSISPWLKGYLYILWFTSSSETTLCTHMISCGSFTPDSKNYKLRKILCLQFRHSTGSVIAWLWHHKMVTSYCWLCADKINQPKNKQINLPWKKIYFTSVMVNSQTKRRDTNVKIKAIVILKTWHRVHFHLKMHIIKCNLNFHDCHKVSHCINE